MWIFISAGVLCLLAARVQSEDSLRNRLKLGSFGLVALGMLFGGAAGVLFNLRAGEHDIKGHIDDVRHAFGRHPSTRFNILSQDGSAADFFLVPNIPQIRNGDEAEVHYQDGSHTVLSLLITSGSNEGFQLTRPDNGAGGSWITLLLGLLLLCYAFFSFVSNEMATTQNSEQDIPSAPPSDVARNSMLKL